MMCSIVSIEDMRTAGVLVLVVDRRGRGLFRPQSPRASDDGGVARVWCVGYGSVAELEDLSIPPPTIISTSGRGRGLGNAKSREARRSCAVGDSDFLDIVSN